MTNMHTVTAWDIVRRLANYAPRNTPAEFTKLRDDAKALLAQVNTEAELRTMLEASQAARRQLTGSLKLCVDRLGEYPDAKGGVALESGLRALSSK